MKSKYNLGQSNINTTNDYASGDFYIKPENTDHKLVSNMVSESVKKLTEKSSASKSWDAMVRYFNNKKSQINIEYTQGEKIFIEINPTSLKGRVKQDSRSAGNYYYPVYNEAFQRHQSIVCETTPPIVLEILRELVNDFGIDQSNISVGDPQNLIYEHNYNAWSVEFPDVVYADNLFGTHGRTLIKPIVDDLVFYSNKSQTDKLYDIIENADYMINVALLKPHLRAGITLTAKNHFGSQSRSGASHLHYSGVSPVAEGNPTNGGYQKYCVMVDIMGSNYLGQNTLLYVVDYLYGLYGGRTSEGQLPVKYFMALFNNDWSSSIFISKDQVTIESVCYDFLRTEWNGLNKHNLVNSMSEKMPSANELLKQILT
jgi:hypothetical protein